MKIKLNLIVRYWIPVFLWMYFIYWLSSFHKLSVSEVSWQDFITRKLAHLTEYAILSMLIYRALGVSFKKLSTNYRSLVTIFISILYSLTDEYHQTFVLGRTGRWFDIGVDSIGVIIGVLALRFNILKNMINSSLSFPRKRESI